MRARASVFAAAIVVVAAGSSLLAQQAAKTEEKQAAKTEGEQTEERKADDKKPEDKWNVNAPPGEAATVAIDTRSGTWMSVDVSPDGRTLVFDLLGDLYTLPIEGGEAKSLTHSIAWEMQARFSPDGKRIAYLSDAGGGDNVWTMDADGKNSAQVTKEDFRLVNNPVWHPSGEYIAARKHYTGTRSLGSGEIWLYHRSGGKGIALNEKPNWQKDLGEPAFAPDARYLYFSQDTSPGRTYQYNRNARGEIYSIQRLDLERGTIEPFVTGPGGAVRPVPSPDGKTLAFVRRLHGRSALFTMDLATGEERPVFEGLERDLQEAWAIQGVYPAFGWTPDSRELVVWGQGKLWRVSIAGGPAREIPFHVKDTREVRKAVRFTTAVAPDRFDVRQLRWATVSPDGGRVVYSALGRLYLKELPAGSPRRLTKTDDRFELFPSFSRDGARVVFTTWNDESAGSVRTLELATGRETSLTKRAGLYLEPRFSPDGRSVVYTKSRGSYLLSPWPGGETGVFRVAADGTGELGACHPRRAGAAVRRDERPRLRHAPRREGGSRAELDARQPEPGRQRRARGGEDRDRHRVRRFPRRQLAGLRRGLPGARGRAAAHRQAPRPRTQGGVAAAAPGERQRGRVPALVRRQPQAPLLARRRAVHARGSSRASRSCRARRPSCRSRPSRGVRIGFAADADKPKGAVALTGARIVTMRGDEVIEDGVIVVRDNRIAAVGRRGAVAVPAGASTHRRLGQDDRSGPGGRALARGDGRGRGDPAAELDRLRLARASA